MLSKNQLKEIQALQLKKHRDARKLFIAEGVKTVVEVLGHYPDRLAQLYGTEAFRSSYGELLASAKVNFTEVSVEELSKISLQATPNQVLAICHVFSPSVQALDWSRDFSFYLDDIRDPGNLGTLIRLADWFGIKSIFCSRETCELYNPKVIQSTMGAFLRVGLEYIELETLLRQQDIKNVYGAVLDGEIIYQQTLQPGLIVIGNEANGIRADHLPLLNKRLTIPKDLGSGAESLNAAVAGAIMASEFYRQLKS